MDDLEDNLIEEFKKLFNLNEAEVEMDNDDMKSHPPLMNEQEFDSILNVIEDDDECRDELRNTLIDNGIYLIDKNMANQSYYEYNAELKGCSKENPIVISTVKKFYAHLEYDIIDFILGYMRIDDYSFVSQSLYKNEGRKLDRLTLEVHDDLYDPDDPKHCVEYRKENLWFDISARFEEMKRRREEKDKI